MKQYERYKDSGVEWLGRVPEHWQVVPGLKIFKENKRLNSKNKKSTILSLSYGKIIIKPKDKLTGLIPKSFETYQVVNIDNIIIRCTDLQNDKESFRVGITKNEGIITNAYLGLIVMNGYSPKFMYYYLHRWDLTKVIYNFGSGLRQNLSWNDLKRLPILLPSFVEQVSISNFLDLKCNQIDKAILHKNKIIERLNERKRIIIQYTTTHGLNPHVLLKDSKIEWIGEIPEHWSIKKLQYLTTKIGSGITPKGGSTIYIDTGIPLLRSQNIHFDKIELSDVAYISSFIDSTMANTRVKEGDVLVNITGGSIGRCHYVDNSLGPANVNQHVCILRPYKLRTQFLYYLMRSAIGQTQIALEQTGGNREGLTFTALKDFQFPIPPIEEQKNIEDFLNQINTQINKIISIKQHEIEKLKEYKTTLIDAAVTGKIKID